MEKLSKLQEINDLKLQLSRLEKQANSKEQVNAFIAELKSLILYVLNNYELQDFERDNLNADLAMLEEKFNQNQAIASVKEENFSQSEEKNEAEENKEDKDENLSETVEKTDIASEEKLDEKSEENAKKEAVAVEDATKTDNGLMSSSEKTKEIATNLNSKEDLKKLGEAVKVVGKVTTKVSQNIDEGKENIKKLVLVDKKEKVSDEKSENSLKETDKIKKEEELFSEDFVIDENLTVKEIKLLVKSIEEKLLDKNLDEKESVKLSSNKLALETRLNQLVAELRKDLVIDGMTPLTEEELELLSEEEINQLEKERKIEVSAEFSNYTRASNSLINGKVVVILPLGVTLNQVGMKISFDENAYTYQKETSGGNQSKYKAITGYDIKLFNRNTGKEVHEFTDKVGNKKNVYVAIYDVKIKKSDELYYSLNYVKDDANIILKDGDYEEVVINSIKDTDLEAKEGLKYGKLEFLTNHFSKYVLFKSDKLEKVNVPEGEVIDTDTFEKLVAQYKAENPNSSSYPMSNTVLVQAGETYTLKEDVRRAIVYTSNGSDVYKHQLFQVQEGGQLIVESKLSGNSSHSPLIVNKGMLNLENGSMLEGNSNEGSYADRFGDTNVQLKVGDRISTLSYQGAGGAVWSAGNVNVNGAIIQNCEAQIGGGIFIEGTDYKTASFNMNSGKFLNNNAIYPKNKNVKGQEFDVYRSAGGGIYMGNYVNGLINDGLFEGNYSDRIGGAISLRDIPRSVLGQGNRNLTTLTITGGNFTENYAKMSGGALCVSSNTDAIVSGGDFTYNKADGIDPCYGTNPVIYAGGAIYVDKYEDKGEGKEGHLYLKNALIANNTSTWHGGGLAACPTSDIKIYPLDGSVFYNNDEINYPKLYYKDISVNTREGGKVKIKNGMLGGFTFSFSDRSEHPSFYRAKANVNQEDVDWLERNGMIKVRITNNTAHIGGGLGVNGSLTVGTETKDEPTEKRIAVSVEKKWDESDLEHPNAVKVNLKKNNENYGEAIELSDKNNWKYTWSDLPYTDGDKYEVVEEVPDGYIAKYLDKGTAYTEVVELESGHNYIMKIDKAYVKVLDNNYDLSGQSKLAFADVWRVYGQGGSYKIVDEVNSRYLAMWNTFNNYGVWNSSDDDKIKLRADKFNYDNGKMYLDYYGNRYIGKYSANGSLSTTKNESQASNVTFYKEIAHNFVITNTKEDFEKPGIRLNKIDSESNNPLKGAEFILYRNAKKADANPETILKLNNFIYSGVEVGALTTDDKGTVVIDDLEPNTVYFLKETKAPENYTKLEKMIVFKVDKNGGFVDLSKLTIDGKTEKAYPESKFIHIVDTSLENAKKDGKIKVFSDDKQLYVKNTKIEEMYKLPETGGEGKEIYMLIGVMMMVSSVGIVLVNRFRRRRA